MKTEIALFIIMVIILIALHLYVKEKEPITDYPMTDEHGAIK